MKSGNLSGPKSMNLMVVWVKDPFCESLLQIDLILVSYFAFRLDVDCYLVVRFIERDLTLAVDQPLYAFGLQRPQIHS